MGPPNQHHKKTTYTKHENNKNTPPSVGDNHRGPNAIRRTSKGATFKRVKTHFQLNTLMSSMIFLGHRVVLENKALFLASQMDQIVACQINKNPL
jgi:hypothetical protein